MRGPRCVVPILALVLAVSLAFGRAWGDPDDSGRAGSDPSDGVTAHREAAALAFVKEHHPELARLLDRLKPMNRVEYESAIEELARTRENLARLRQRNPERFQHALELWKAKSRVDLLTARLVSDPDPRLESALRRALADQVAAQLRQQKYDREQLRKRLEQLDQSIRRLDRDGDAMVQSRFESTMKKVQRLRRRADDRGPDAAARSNASNPRPTDRSEGGSSK